LQEQFAAESMIASVARSKNNAARRDCGGPMLESGDAVRSRYFLRASA
jgi:hypothetical protein